MIMVLFQDWPISKSMHAFSGGAGWRRKSVPGAVMREAALCVVAALALQACAMLPSFTAPGDVSQTPLPASTRPAYNLSGYPPSFKEGYIDGCETAKGSAYGKKDPQRFGSDNQYRMGWSDGVDLCRGTR
jgi:hypothetical protein